MNETDTTMRQILGTKIVYFKSKGSPETWYPRILGQEVVFVFLGNEVKMIIYYKEHLSETAVADIPVEDG